MYNLFRKKHQLWIKITFVSFMFEDEISDKIYDISKIYFRHLKWLSKYLKQNDIDYDYFKDEDFNIKYQTTHDAIKDLILNIDEVMLEYKQNTLFSRFLSDDEYVTSYLKTILLLQDSKITAFDKSLQIDNKTLDESSKTALVKFLFEESYKEYELVMVYLYMQVRTDSVVLFDIFNDLVEESHYHLKSFGKMMAKLGILTAPRTILEDIYKIDNVMKFLIDGIEEEEAAKILCQQLASEIKDEELSRFFTFIDNQENYHIELLKEAIEELS